MELAISLLVGALASHFVRHHIEEVSMRNVVIRHLSGKSNQRFWRTAHTNRRIRTSCLSAPGPRTDSRGATSHLSCNLSHVAAATFLAHAAMGYKPLAPEAHQTRTSHSSEHWHAIANPHPIRSASLRGRAARRRPRALGAIDGTTVCEAVREDEQERCGRCGGDLRSGEPTEHALCADQEH